MAETSGAVTFEVGVKCADENEAKRLILQLAEFGQVRTTVPSCTFHFLTPYLLVLDKTTLVQSSSRTARRRIRRSEGRAERSTIHDTWVQCNDNDHRYSIC